MIALARVMPFPDRDHIASSPICGYRSLYNLEAMMTVRDMERLLASFGIPVSYLDQITRRLREDGRIPNAGKGATAPDIGPREVAVILLAIAGSDAATRQRLALARLALVEIEGDARPRYARGFIQSIEALLSSATAAGSVSEIRVAKDNGPCSILYDDGYLERFVPIDRAGTPVLRNEAIIWGGLLGELQIEMSGERLAADGGSVGAKGKQDA